MGQSQFERDWQTARGAVVNGAQSLQRALGVNPAAIAAERTRRNANVGSEIAGVVPKYFTPDGSALAAAQDGKSTKPVSRPPTPRSTGDARANAAAKAARSASTTVPADSPARASTQSAPSKPKRKTPKPGEKTTMADVKKDVDPALVPVIEAEAMKEEAAEQAAAGKPEQAQSTLDRAAAAYRKAIEGMPQDDPRRDALISFAQFGANLAGTDSPNFLQAVGQAAGPAIASYEQMRAQGAQRALEQAKMGYALEKDGAEFAMTQAKNEAELAKMEADGLLSKEQLEAARFQNKNAPQLLAVELAAKRAEVEARRAQAAASYASADESRAGAEQKRAETANPERFRASGGASDSRQMIMLRNSMGQQLEAALAIAADRTAPKEQIAAANAEVARLRPLISQIDRSFGFAGAPAPAGGNGGASTAAPAGGNGGFRIVG